MITVDGHLGRDAKIFVSVNGNEFIAFSMACNSRLKNVQKTTWYDVIIPSVDRYRNLVPYLTKGKYIFVTGDLDVSLVKDNNGVDRLRLTINANAVNFPSLRKDDGGESSVQTVEEKKKEEEIKVTTSATPTKTEKPSSTPVQNATYDDDEELPF
jgi:single stranded DNA-binding protein